MKFLILTLFLIFPFSQAKAAEAPHNACAEDVAKLCKEAKPGEALNTCMKAHDAQISQGCKDQVAAYKAKFMAMEKMKEVQVACKADVDKFCKGKTAADHQIANCMHDHHNDLSKGCVAAIVKK